MQFPSYDHESFIVIPHTFYATRVYKEDELSRISAAKLTLKIACTPIDDDTLGHVELGQKAMVGFQRLKVWLEALLDNVILVDVNSELLAEFQENVHNNIMFIPGNPDDSMLSVVLHAKMCSITKGLLDIHHISLRATDTDNIERYYRNLSGEYPLPGIEYVGEEVAHKTPWWSRPTIDICEYEDESESGILAWPADPLASIGKEYLTNGDEADIIVFDAWKKPEK